MNITLLNGMQIENIPEGTSDEEIRTQTIAAGLASEEDFRVLDFVTLQDWQRPGVGFFGWLGQQEGSTGYRPKPVQTESPMHAPGMVRDGGV